MLYRALFVTNSSSSAYLYWGISMSEEEAEKLFREKGIIKEDEEIDGCWDCASDLLYKWREETGQKHYPMNVDYSDEEGIVFFYATNWTAEYETIVINPTKIKERDREDLKSFMEYINVDSEPEYALHHHGMG